MKKLILMLFTFCITTPVVCMDKIHKNIDVVDASGETLLFKAVKLNKKYLIKHLLDAKAHPNNAFSNGGRVSVLQLAAERRQHDLMTLLLQHGADANAKTTAEYRPLEFAHDSKALKILFDNGAQYVPRFYYRPDIKRAFLLSEIQKSAVQIPPVAQIVVDYYGN